MRLTESQLQKVIKESVKKILKEEVNHQKDYQEFVQLFNGLTFREATSKVDELGLYYGACNPQNSNDMLDINYKSILGTVYFRGQVDDSYEEYDENEQFVQLHH